LPAQREHEARKKQGIKAIISRKEFQISSSFGTRKEEPEEGPKNSKNRALTHDTITIRNSPEEPEEGAKSSKNRALTIRYDIGASL
jgi:hypothetical protein